jgi:dihydrofolate synthase / folylpolyglutamate synthase
VDPLSFLFSLERLGMKFGLENISRLCEALDHPERTFRSVIVAGTNGKGSVTAMTETALRAAGHRTGRYTSPHLTRLEERFVVDGADVTTGELTRALGRIQDAATALAGDGTLEALPTFFEAATATAFEVFRRARVEIAVLEVGLGGRLDATNVVTPMAAAIASIDLDHQAQLGDTIESIAREKAGVIKPNLPVVCGRLPAAAEGVIRGIARECGARFVSAPDYVQVDRRAGGAFDFTTGSRALRDVHLALPGAHQVENATVAIALLDEIDRLGVRMTDAAVRSGLSDVVWPGRLERVAWRGADVMLDAAHNPAGAAALARYVREIGWQDAVLVFGAMRDKDVAGMVAALAPAFARIVCTTAASPRAMPADELAALASSIAACPVESAASPEEAMARARDAGARIVAAGSMFLIGPLRGILR